MGDAQEQGWGVKTGTDKHKVKEKKLSYAYRSTDGCSETKHSLNVQPFVCSYAESNIN